MFTYYRLYRRLKKAIKNYRHTIVCYVSGYQYTFFHEKMDESIVIEMSLYYNWSDRTHLLVKSLPAKYRGKLMKHLETQYKRYEKELNKSYIKSKMKEV